MTGIQTVGHSALPRPAFLELLRTRGVGQIVDVRAFPRSRRHPWFNRPALEAALAEAGMAYVWRGDELGGFRKPRPDSKHTALTTPGFRGFAEYMESPDFARALDDLVKLASRDSVAIMCAEANVANCHRRFISDALCLRGIEVTHIGATRPPFAHTLDPTIGDAGPAPVYNRHAQGDLFT